VSATGRDVPRVRWNNGLSLPPELRPFHWAGSPQGRITCGFIAGDFGFFAHARDFTACGIRGADLRPDFDWDKKTAPAQ
jgi:hypothetical protein